MSDTPDLEAAFVLADVVLVQGHMVGTAAGWRNLARAYQESRIEVEQLRVQLEATQAKLEDEHSYSADCRASEVQACRERDEARAERGALLMDLQRTSGDVFCPCCMCHARVVEKHRALLSTKGIEPE